MGKTVKIALRGGGYQVCDMRDVERLNREEGRKRLNGEQLDSMIGLVVAKRLGNKCSEDLEKFLKFADAWKEYRAGVRFMKTAISKALGKVNVEQVSQMEVNTAGAVMTLSADRTMLPKQYVGIEMNQLLAIADQALHHCSITCSCDALQSRDCMLRKAFDAVPGLKDEGGGGWDLNDNACPYQMLDALQKMDKIKDL